ncbi:MAG: antibiotic biosynthesis monooxygenase [Thermomicrobiales bacterium]|nr:antibiotic biosynthesis monooxygenase [Thermomicrobiales bacterium]
MIVLMAQHFAQEGNEERVAELLKEAAAYCNSDQEPGCLAYIVNRSKDNPRHFLIYEQYVDEDALTAHAESDMFKNLILGTEVPLLESRSRSFWDLVE